MQDKTLIGPPSAPRTVPPGSMSYMMRQKLGLSEGPLDFRANECAHVEYLPTVAHNHCWQASIYSMPWYDMGEPGYFRDYCGGIGPERTHITLRTPPTPWGLYAMRRIAEETGGTILSNAEADAYLVAWEMRENERRSWPRWMKLVYLACEALLNRTHREPKLQRSTTMREVLADPDVWV